MPPQPGGIAGTMPMSQVPILRGLGAAPHFIDACKGQARARRPLGPQRSWPEVRADERVLGVGQDSRESETGCGDAWGQTAAHWAEGTVRL